MRAAIIGGGSIGSSLAHALVHSKRILPEHLIVVERNEQSCDELRRTLRCYASTSYYPTLAEADLLILAVKPQDFPGAAEKLKDLLKPRQIVVSMMAGISSARLSGDLGEHRKIFRCMPNLPFTVGLGLSVCFQSPAIDPADRDLLSALLSTCGTLLFVANEELIDAATALSASGPGLLAYFAGHFEQAARDLGFSAAEARTIVSRTFLGTAELLSRDEWTHGEIQARVSSKGGTTEAGIHELEERKAGEALQSAFRRAYERARELGRS